MTGREQLLDELRPYVFAIAYRMLGSVSEAEDIAQEVLLRVHQVLERGDEITSPRAFAATVATRLAINDLRSARARRESYVGEWLPEPIVNDAREDPVSRAETADSLSLAMLVVLESLSPEQRAVLLLHDVFDYGYREVAAIIGKSEDNTRQLAARARRLVRDGRPRFRSTRDQREELTRRFFVAVEHGDVAGLESMLAHDVTLTGDGGGEVPALAQTIQGRSRVARAVARGVGRLLQLPGVSWRPVDVNDGAGALLLDGEARVIAVCALGTSAAQITAIHGIVNPGKLRHVGVVGDLATLLQQTR